MNMHTHNSETADETLQKAVETLYHVFSRYPLREHIDKLLRELSSSDLSRYSLEAMRNPSDVDAFRHFLPRLFDLMSEGIYSGLADAPIITGKLAYADWTSWPEEERQAISDFLMAYWQASLIAYPGRFDTVEGTLAAIARTGLDLHPYLEVLLHRITSAIAYHLSHFVIEAVNRLCDEHQLLGAYWKEVPDQHAVVIAWLRATPVYERLETLFINYEQTDPELAGQLSTATGMLDILKSESPVGT